MTSLPEEYQWSSYRGYIGLSKAPDWLNEDFILGYFGGNRPEARNRYRQFAEDLLDNEYDSPLKQVTASTILGRPEFVNESSTTETGRNAKCVQCARYERVNKKPFHG
jgi:putative transposase